MGVARGRGRGEAREGRGGAGHAKAAGGSCEVLEVLRSGGGPAAEVRSDGLAEKVIRGPASGVVWFSLGGAAVLDND